MSEARLGEAMRVKEARARASRDRKLTASWPLPFTVSAERLSCPVASSCLSCLPPKCSPFSLRSKAPGLNALRRVTNAGGTTAAAAAVAAVARRVVLTGVALGRTTPAAAAAAVAGCSSTHELVLALADGPPELLGCVLVLAASAPCVVSAQCTALPSSRVGLRVVRRVSAAARPSPLRTVLCRRFTCIA